MEYYRNNGVKCYEPDNDRTTLYIKGSSFSYTLSEILEICKDYFGDAASLDSIEIEVEYIQTYSIGYDEYDPSDYSCYLVCKLNAEK
jgi:hypothetical protein